MSLDTILLENSLLNLLIRFFMNLGVLFILIGIIYYKFSQKADYLFSYILMGVMIFLISSILGSIEIQIGMALGLFAIFAILRFRTVQYTVKDITYMFVIIGISVINSQANIPPPILGAFIVNLSVIVITYLLELFLLKNGLEKFTIIYNKLELIKPGFKKELLKDLSRHTGLEIEKVKIISMNIKKGNAEIEIFFKDKSKE